MTPDIQPTCDVSLLDCSKHLTGRVHRAIVAATARAIVMTIAATVASCIRYRRSSRRRSPVSSGNQPATIASTCRGDDCPVYMPHKRGELPHKMRNFLIILQHLDSNDTETVSILTNWGMYRRVNPTIRTVRKHRVTESEQSTTLSLSSDLSHANIIVLSTHI